MEEFRTAPPQSEAPVQEVNQTPETPVNQNKKKMKVPKFLKKYWFGIIGVLLLCVLAGAFIVQSNNTAAKWDRAQDYFTKADYEKAADELITVKMPSDADKLNVYSKTMHATANDTKNKDRYEKALTAYQKLYEIKKDPQTKVMMANIYMQQKNYSPAEKLLDEIIAANPSYTQAYINLATMYRLQGKQTDAIAIAKKGVESNPNNVSLNELVVALLLDQKDSQAYKDALANLKKSNPNSELLKTLQ